MRIGGIYALERIARDSAKDHPTVMEVLTAFIREHSRDQWPRSHPHGRKNDAGHAPDAFLDWYAARHDEVPAAVTEATATISEEWGPHEYPDERSFYACSPHRIEMAAHLIRES